MGELLRVFFVNDSWTTIPCEKDSTALDICNIICTKRNLIHLKCSIYIHYNNFERKLDDHEIPLDIYNTILLTDPELRNVTNKLKFIFKINKSSFNLSKQPQQGEEEDNSFLYLSDDDINDDEMFTQSINIENINCIQKQGYMYKRGSSKKSAWRLRWFIIQHEKLYYFKNHESIEPLGFIVLKPAIITYINPKDYKYVSMSSKLCYTAMVNNVSLTMANNATYHYIDHLHLDDYIIHIDTPQRLYELKLNKKSQMLSWYKELNQYTKLDLSKEFLNQLSYKLNLIEYNKASYQLQQIELYNDLDYILTHSFSLDMLYQYCLDELNDDHFALSMLILWIYIQDYKLDHTLTTMIATSNELKCYLSKMEQANVTTKQFNDSQQQAAAAAAGYFKTN